MSDNDTKETMRQPCPACGGEVIRDGDVLACSDCGMWTEGNPEGFWAGEYVDAPHEGGP